jgi:hypothetical protein
MSQTADPSAPDNPEWSMANAGDTAQALTRTPQAFLSEAAGAIVLENGAVAFDLAQSKYSISGEYNRCLLHLWSAERNAVRRVLEAEVKNGTLRLAVQRMGQARPSRLEICRDRDRRSPSTRRAGRAVYDQRLRRTLERHFPDFKIVRLTSGVDLEKSFGPIYPRGLIRQGRTAFAVLGMNAQETQSSIDAALTFGILWPDVCRKAPSANVVVEGLKQFVPAGTSSLTRERMANLNRAAAARDRFGALLRCSADYILRVLGRARNGHSANPFGRRWSLDCPQEKLETEQWIRGTACFCWLLNLWPGRTWRGTRSPWA